MITLDDIYLRCAVLGIMLGPLAVSNFRSRTVMTDILYMCAGISACFFAYDVLSGWFDGQSFLVYAGFAISVATATAMMVMARAFKVIGTADAIAVMIITMTLPAVSGIPIAPIAAVAGSAGAILYIAGGSLVRNLSDMKSGRKFCRDMIYTHIKRKGEKFAISNPGTRKIGGASDDGTIHDTSGGSFFEDHESSGMPVTTAMPMITMYAIGLCGTVCVLFFTNIDGSYLIDAIRGVAGGISFELGF